MEVMYVIKRDGSKENVSFDKVSNRFHKLVEGDPGMSQLKIDYISLSQKVCKEMYSGVHTHELDELAAQTCATMITESSDFGDLASRLAISNHHKKTSPSFSETVQLLYSNTNSIGVSTPLVTKEFYNTVMKHKTKFNQIIDYSRDYLLDYFAFKTLEKSYLIKVGGSIVERPQHLFLRVSIGIHGTDVKSAIECYHALSTKKYIHATPTLFNAGTTNGQLASCFLMGINEDSIVGIYDSLKDTALISKNSGGIGIHIHDVRARGSMIGGGTGTSSGIVPMLRVFNNTAKYVDQCVIPETIIYTTDGPMEIQNVVAGETMIYNSKGIVETIDKVLEHPYKGELYEIETMHSFDKLKVTDEHPVLVVENQKKGIHFSAIANGLDKKIIQMTFKDTKELSEDDLLVYSVPKFERDYEDITEDDCYLYGVILGDGSLQNENTYGYISLNISTKKHVLDFCESYFIKRCIDYKFEETDSEDYIRVCWNKSVNIPFKYSDIYDQNKEKRIHKKWLNLPLTKARYIVKGLLDTDRCYGSFDKHPKELCFDNTSRMLVEGFRFILLRMGVLTSGNIINLSSGNLWKSLFRIGAENKISYTVRVPITEEIVDLLCIEEFEEYEEFDEFMKYTNDMNQQFIMTRIKSISKSSYSGTLYDLEMKDTHDYMLHQGIVHNGGGKRNGSFAIYLEPWHADINDFLDLRKNTGFEEIRARDLFYALWIPDLFMQRVEEDSHWTLMCPYQCPGLADVYGEEFNKKYIGYEESGLGTRVSAQELWFKILESQIETGTPYLLFKDACNKKSNQSNLGTIKSSNLCCVTPDTKILTKKGYYPIKDLENNEVEVWNGKSWSKTTPMKTGDNKKILTVKFSNSLELKCTEYHKFYIETGTRPSQKSVPEIVEAKDLKPKMKIIRYDTIVCEDSHNYMNDAYTIGSIGQVVPINCSIESKIGWLEGFIDSQGLINDELCNIQIYCKEKPILIDVFYLLQTLGVTSCITNESHLILDYYGVQKLKSFGFSPKRLNIDQIREPHHITNKFVTIVDVEDNEEYSDTYCFNEPMEHKGIFNGILTGQCEIVEYSGKDETAVCNLASLSLPSYILKPDVPGKISIFGIENCVYCQLIKSWCDKWELNYEYSKVQPEVGKKYPQIFVKDKENNEIFSGGYTSFTETFPVNYDYPQLEEMTRQLTRNLNKVIDKTTYPIESARRSNTRHRPIGIGVQGLSDVFMKMRVSFDSEKAREVNDKIFETMYYAAISESMKLAKKKHDKKKPNDGNKYPGAYSTFDGCPLSQGKFQFDLWNTSPSENEPKYKWDELRTEVQTYGVVNSLLISPMPTASSSTILGNNECFEPITSNIYVRRTLAGEFIVMNKHLQSDLQDLNMWNKEMKDNILLNSGSIQQIEGIPQCLKDSYKTVWEISQKVVIDLAADRGKYICQSQSMNLFIAEPQFDVLTSMFFYAWKSGLKTGCYYLRTRPQTKAQQFSIEVGQQSACESCSA